MKKLDWLKKLISIACSLALISALLVGCDNGTETSESGSSTTSSDGTTGEDNSPAEDDSNESNSEASGLDASNLTIGLSMQTLDGAYFATQESAFKAACDAEGITLYSTDAQGDMSKQLSDVEDLISRGCDVIVINPKDPLGAVAATESCANAGIPVFIMDNSIDASATYVSMIQSDNYNLGFQVGIDVAEHFGSDEIRIGLLSGNPGNALGVSRRMGAMAGILETQLAANNASSVKILTQVWGNWNQQ